MRRFIVCLLFGLVTIHPAMAALKVGDTAPDFTAQAAVGGSTFSFTLSEALKRGPVVLYFFPKAFTAGCSAEAHAFAEAAESFKAEGATLIGMSADTIQTLTRFSTKECQARFPVAADPDLAVVRRYDVVMVRLPVLGGVSDRTSFVIAPEGAMGKIIYAYTAMSPDQHVANTLAALRRWRADHPK